MARKQIIQLIDDLSGETLDENGETVRFSLDGRPYEIDLSVGNAKKLRDALQPFVAASRSVGSANRSTPPRGRSPRSSTGRDLGAVREWARANGHEVSARGRVSASVLSAYDAAN